MCLHQNIKSLKTSELSTPKLCHQYHSKHTRLRTEELLTKRKAKKYCNLIFLGNISRKKQASQGTFNCGILVSGVGGSGDWRPKAEMGEREGEGEC